MKLNILVILLTLCIGAVASDLADATFRVRGERDGMAGAKIVSSGTAFGADLSKWGMSGKRYLLSARHNIDLAEKVLVEVGQDWVKCDVISSGEDLDICILKSSIDLKGILRLDQKEPEIGVAIEMAGSPNGYEIQEFEGRLTHTFFGGSLLYRAAIRLDQGDSGGPVLSSTSKRVIGMVVAGLPAQDGLDHRFALFIPSIAIKSFLDKVKESNK
jgi:S1-C subfamily serine protease